MKHISTIIKQQRKVLKLTQQELADISEVSMLLVSQIERGKETVRFDKLLAILNSLGLEICIRRGKATVTSEGLE